MRRCTVLILLLLLMIAAPLAADELSRPAPEGLGGHAALSGAARGTSFMAVTAHPLASQAAYDILEQGGSAADAAVAAQLVLGLTEPQSSGLGGGAFALYYDAASGMLQSWDGRETAPQGAGPDLFLDQSGAALPFYNAVLSPDSIGVPGTPALLARLHLEHGTLPWAALFEKALALATEGFAISPRLHALISEDQERLLLNMGDDAGYFFDEIGMPHPEGTMLRNPAYARTLTAFRDGGAAVFYDPAAPGSLVPAMIEAAQGRLSPADFAGYHIFMRPPLCGEYRAHLVCGMGPPSSGGLAVAQILGLLENFNLAASGPEDPQALHLIAEASRLAFADRNHYVGDPDFVDVPDQALLAPEYLARRAALIDPKARQAQVIAGQPDREGGTSHITIIDQDGNIISMTTTIESAFGSRRMAAGFFLNNELTDFAFDPLDQDGQPRANRAESGKRPRSSMAPTIVFDPNGAPVIALGSAGGSRIIGCVAQRLIALIDWNADLAAALEMPHALARSDTVELEAGPGQEALAEKLRKYYGHQVQVGEMNSGLTGIIRRGGLIYGAADPRREGTARGR